MASGEDERELNAFRTSLMRSLTKTGTVDTLKAALRGQIVSQLSKRGHGPGDGPHRPTLRQRALDSLVLSHMNASSYEYAASVFSSEAHLADGGTLSADEICAALNLGLGALPPAEPDSGGVSQLAAAIAGHRPPAGGTASRGTQTTDADAALSRGSLESQLRRVDEAAANAKAARGALPASAALQEHMLRYQREVDEAAKKQLAAEVRRVKEVEAVQIRAEERAAARAELDRTLNEQQAWTAKQVAAMRRQEAEASAAMRKREEAFETSCYEHRQRMLTELDGLRSREAQLHAEADAKMAALKGQAELLASQKVRLEPGRPAAAAAAACPAAAAPR